MNDQITAQEWFSTGTRVIYDPVSKKMVERAKETDIAGEIRVWKRVERDAGQSDQESWTTFLPGFPDGSFGWAKVDWMPSDSHSASTRSARSIVP